MTVDWTTDELIINYMSLQIIDRDFVVQGMGTPLVFNAFLLAKATHAPGVQFMYTVGNSISEKAGRLSLSHVESNTIEHALRYVSMTQMHLEIVPSLYAKEFMRPAQVDKYGNANNVVIGDYASPKVRLPGSAGVSDVESFNYNTYFYVTRHSRQTLVDKLDFCSSVGFGEREKELDRLGKRKRGPQQIITDKCIFDLANGYAELKYLHPGVTINDVVENTGFAFDIRNDLETTPTPTDENINLLRTEIDPLNLRKLEFLSGNKRLEHIEWILEQEKMAFGF